MQMIIAGVIAVLVVLIVGCVYVHTLINNHIMVEVERYVKQYCGIVSRLNKRPINRKAIYRKPEKDWKLP